MMSRNPYIPGDQNVNDATPAASTSSAQMAAGEDLGLTAGQQRMPYLQRASQMFDEAISTDQLSMLYVKDKYVSRGRSLLGEDAILFYRSQDVEIRSHIETIIWKEIQKNVVERDQDDTFAVVITDLKQPIAEASITDDQLRSIYSKTNYITSFGTTVFTTEERAYYQNQQATTQASIMTIIRQTIDAKGLTEEGNREYNHAYTTLETRLAGMVLTTPQRSQTDPAASNNGYQPIHDLVRDDEDGGLAWDKGSMGTISRR